MALQGSLSELSLPDVIQMVSVSGKTGVFEVVRSDEVGRIHLNDGQIVDAEVGSLRGDDAVYEMVIWSEGDFSFKPGAAAETTTIHLSNANLLMEAARRLDEWRVLARKIPSLDRVPYFTSRDQADQVTLSPHEWILITRIDDEHTIEEIAEQLSWSAFDVSKLLFGMITSGLVALRSSSSTPTASANRKGPTPLTLLGLAQRIRSVALDVVGSGGEQTIDKQYAGARTLIEQGAGVDAIKTMVEQHSNAITLLKGAEIAAMFDEQVRPLLGDATGAPGSATNSQGGSNS
ncbi:MAG: DUF4388 domain-containing protein [Thermoanaerobaculales bacterium]|jgi:hypothetical protein|nr:DUF4388 domain-containing protein [Thermoanaerobaculales bacterium]